MSKNTWFLLLAGIFIFLVGLLVGSNYLDLSTYVRGHSIVAQLKEIAPYAGWLSAFLALVGLVWQVSQARYKMEVEIILKMSERFDSDKMQSHRVQASKHLLSEKTDSSSDVDAVLDFFEDMAFLVHKKAISEETAWQYFSYWVLQYAPATEAYRDSYCKEGTGMFVFEGVEKLHEQLLKIEKEKFQKAGKIFKEVNREDIKSFLGQEINLVGKPDRFRIKPTTRKAQ